jgi:hypothetical protein
MKARIYAEVQAGNRKQRTMRELVTGDYWCLAAIRDSPPKSRSESEEDKHPYQFNTFHSASIAVASRAAVTPGSPPPSTRRRSRRLERSCPMDRTPRLAGLQGPLRLPGAAVGSLDRLRLAREEDPALLHPVANHVGRSSEINPR